MFFNVPVLVMLAALRSRQRELADEIYDLARWREEVRDLVVERAEAAVSEMIRSYEAQEPETVVEIKLLPPGGSVYDADEKTKEQLVSLYRFNKPEFERYEAVAGTVAFE